MIGLLLLAVVAYIIGSIPSGYWIARYKGIDDIRATGSGNIGATNVARALGAHYFFLVFFCDFIKSYAFLRILQMHQFDQSILIISSLALLMGNAFSLFLQFRGGKGVATSFGIFLALMPPVALAVFTVWLFVLIVFKTVGLASIAGLIFLPCAAWFMNVDCAILLFASVTSILGLYLHRNNIKSYMAHIFNSSAL